MLVSTARKEVFQRSSKLFVDTQVNIPEHKIKGDSSQTSTDAREDPGRRKLAASSETSLLLDIENTCDLEQYVVRQAVEFSASPQSHDVQFRIATSTV